MSIRTSLYHALRERISHIDAVRHIDLWNHNVEFITQEQAWERPAVFVEFLPITWHGQQPQSLYTATAQINLHLVTDWTCTEDALAAFALSDALHHALADCSGEGFRAFDLVATHTNHNHEDILESIDTYQCTLLHRF